MPTGDWVIEFDNIKTSSTDSYNQAQIDIGAVANRITFGQVTGSGKLQVIEIHNSSVIQTKNNGTMPMNTLVTHRLEFVNGVYKYTVLGNSVTLTPQYITSPTEITTMRIGSYNKANNLKVKPL